MIVTTPNGAIVGMVTTICGEYIAVTLHMMPLTSKLCIQTDGGQFSALMREAGDRLLRSAQPGRTHRIMSDVDVAEGLLGTATFRTYSIELEIEAVPLDLYFEIDMR